MIVKTGAPSERKRKQIDSARQQLVMWLSLAGCAVIITLIVGLNFWHKIVYQHKVNVELGKTEAILKKNVDSIKSLKDNVNALKSDEALNLPQLKSEGKSSLQLVLDAMPTKHDATSLGSSLQERILSRSGVAITAMDVSPSTDQDTSESASDKSAQAAQFSVTISGSISAVKNALHDMENSLRTITINDMTLDGTNDKMTAKITATTYYLPKVQYKLGEKEVKP